MSSDEPVDLYGEHCVHCTWKAYRDDTVEAIIDGDAAIWNCPKCNTENVTEWGEE